MCFQSIAATPPPDERYITPLVGSLILHLAATGVSYYPLQPSTSVGANAPVAQRIEHLTTDQKVGGSNPSGRADGNPAFVAGFRSLEEALSGSRQKYPRLNSYLR